MRYVLRAAALAAGAAICTNANVVVTTFGNTAFGGSGTASTQPAISIYGGVPNATSIRFDGTISAPQTEFMNFTVTTDGIVRLWLDDHLLIEDTNAGTNRSINGFYSFPFMLGTAYPFRLEYMHASGPSTVVLAWQGNFTAPQVVPASAFAATIAPERQQRQALRDRLYNPAIPWQTAYNPSMTTQVHLPSGFALDFTLGNATNNKQVLGFVSVFRRNDPARTLVGPHSYAGDITEVTVDAWNGCNCSVLLQSSVANGGADLLYLVTATGSDCGTLVLLATPTVLWNRMGAFDYVPGRNDAISAAMPGFANITAFAVTPAPVSFNGITVGFALPLTDGGIAAVSTGSVYDVAQIASSIATARAAQMARISAYGNLSALYEAMQSIIAWNTMYSPDEGVVTPVSRGWDFGHGYVIFDWDNLFLAYMASLEAGTARDIAYSNLIQIVKARTLAGFVPNFASGLRVSFDRTEPQIGAYVTREIFRKWGDTWLVTLLFNDLLGWNNWVWTRRRGEGTLAPPGGYANLVVLGTDPGDPMGDGTTNTLQGARYESGLDNSPMYDSPPVQFNNVTHHMELYDVGMTALFLSDTAALMDLATAINRTDVLPMLQARFANVSAALNTHMWDAEAGIYTNVLFNGSFYKRYAPTSFFPMIAGVASDAQAASLASWLTSQTGFCVNATAGDPNEALLFQWFKNSVNDRRACATDDCTRDNVIAAYGWVRQEARVLVTPPPGVPTVTLNMLSSSDGRSVLTTEAFVPPGFTFVRAEGECFVSASDAGPDAVNLTLYYSATGENGAYLTCADSNACDADVHRGGFVPVTHLCFARNASLASSWPCRYGVPSISRADPAFTDNNYWRGRIWGPHMQLVYWALRAYDHVPAVHAARQTLVAQGAALVTQEWSWFRHVNENMNGFLGVGSDVGDADPFYHWGALPGFLSFLEAGMY